MENNGLEEEQMFAIFALYSLERFELHRDHDHESEEMGALLKDRRQAHNSGRQEEGKKMQKINKPKVRKRERKKSLCR